jgi:hypothetical protein
MPQPIGQLLINIAYWAAGATPEAATAAGTTTVLGISTAQIVGTIALNAAAIGIETALAPSPKLSSQKVSIRSAVAPRRRGYGETRLSGVIVLIKRSIVTGDGILYLVVIIHYGEIDSISEHWFGDQIVRIDETGARVSPPGAAVYPARFLDGQRVTIQSELGAASQVANALLTAAFPGFWTDDHRLDGLAYSTIKLNGTPLEDFGEVYSGIPNYTAKAKLSKVWDPRDDGQDPDDSSTWTWSDNAALVVLDYLWHADGMGLPRALIETAIDDWKAKADSCDELVPLISGGTEKRYRLSGAYELTDARKTVLGAMLNAIDGRVRLREDGAIVLDIGEFETPTAAETFGADDIVSYANFGRGLPKDQLKNVIRATYLSPGHNYQQQEADPWKDQSSIDLDGELTAALSLDWCFSHRQARLRMKVEAKRLSPSWAGTVITNARGLNLLGKRYCHLTIPDLGVDEDFYIKPGAQFDLLSGRCSFDVVSFAASDYDFDPDSEEGVSPENATPGDHGIAVPANATQLAITADGAGAGGSDAGGGAGARAVKTIAIDPADWGQVIRFHVGAHGIGEAVNVIGGVMTDGEDSTVDATLTAGTIAIIAGGGKKGTNSPGLGGAASGGDTNTSGGSGHGAGPGVDGGIAASGAPANEKYGGGGDEQTDGADGFIDFQWTF